MLTTDEKGSIAESEVVCASIRLGIGVWKPVRSGERCDLIFDVGGTLIRVQCKWAVRRGEVILVRCYSCRRTREGFVKHTYTRQEVDAIAAYCPDLDRCYFLPLDRFCRGRRSDFGSHLRRTTRRQA
jgi:hypothetical protein